MLLTKPEARGVHAPRLFFLYRLRLKSVLALERLKAFFEVEQPVQGIAADFRIESPHRPAVVDLQEFNQSFRLGNVRADPFAWIIRKPSLRSSRY